MSVFNNKKKDPDPGKGGQNKPRNSFAFVEDDSQNEKDPQDIKDFLSSGRGDSKKSLNPRGRPRVSQDDKKQETVLIYLTKKQKKELENKAKNSSLSVSKYVLLKVFGID
jgi:hypothetical protein